MREYTAASASILLSIVFIKQKYSESALRDTHHGADKTATRGEHTGVKYPSFHTIRPYLFRPAL
jgi:hypothetical protein